MVPWHLCSWAGRTQLSVFLSEMVLDWNVCHCWIQKGLVACQLMGQTGWCWDHQLPPDALSIAHSFWGNLRISFISFPLHFLLLTSFVFHCMGNNTKGRQGGISHKNFNFSFSMGSSFLLVFFLILISSYWVLQTAVTALAHAFNNKTLVPASI